MRELIERIMSMHPVVFATWVAGFYVFCIVVLLVVP